MTTPAELDQVLAAHKLWLDNAGGQRADLRGADLNWAELRGAELGGADLRGADLSGANGVVFLTQSDHGHTVLAQLVNDEWRIRAGCRDFSLAEARAHCGATDYHLPFSGRRIIACLDWFEAELSAGRVPR